MANKRTGRTRKGRFTKGSAAARNAGRKGGLAAARKRRSRSRRTR